MHISIFTPTHNPQWLARAGDSIRKCLVDGLSVQWVIVVNGECTVDMARNAAIQAGVARITEVHQAPDLIKGVGALKRFAVDRCTGDVLVELDHDDELLPPCLEAIAKVMDPAEKMFFYSDAVLLQPDDTAKIYGEQFGWKNYQWGKYRVNEAFPATPRSLAEIFYAPNHVRAWTAKAYWAAGGYDAHRHVCDDHALLIRTYLSGATFYHHGEPLYVQHMHGENTQWVLHINEQIQREQAKLRDENLLLLVCEWCRRTGLAMLDFGGAFNCPAGFVPVDRREVPGGLCVDLSKGIIPAVDQSIGCIRAHDFLEHIPIGSVVPLMNEIHRKLAPGGFLTSSTPSTDGRGAYQDPTHVSFWNQNSFWYYTRQEQNQFVPEITARFQATRLFTHFPGEYHAKHHIAYVHADLMALHGQRAPGEVGFPRSVIQ